MSATGPLVMNVFVPLSRQPPRATLVVRNGDGRSIDGRHVISLATPDNVKILLRTWSSVVNRDGAY